MKIPGIIYSLLLAVAAWAVDYFTSGRGRWLPVGAGLGGSRAGVAKTACARW